MALSQMCSEVWLYFMQKDEKIWSLATIVKFLFHQRGELPPICRNIWPHSNSFIMLIDYYLATEVRQAAAELTGRHQLLMPKVTLNSPGRPGSVYLVNVSTISFCKLLLNLCTRSYSIHRV